MGLAPRAVLRPAVSVSLLSGGNDEDQPCLLHDNVVGGRMGLAKTGQPYANYHDRVVGVVGCWLLVMMAHPVLEILNPSRAT